MSLIQDVKVINSGSWDELVMKTYGRPYCFQQQDGCKERGVVYLTIPSQAYDFENSKVNEKDIEDMGVSFKAWLERDPNEWKGRAIEDKEIFWQRNFYPDVQMIANDLFEKGLIESGNYLIDINW